MLLNLYGRIRYFFQNLSGRAIRDLIAAAIILCISVALSLPAFFSDMREYKNSERIKTEEGSKIASPSEAGTDETPVNNKDNE